MTMPDCTGKHNPDSREVVCDVFAAVGCISTVPQVLLHLTCMCEVLLASSCTANAARLVCAQRLRAEHNINGL